MKRRLISIVVMLLLIAGTAPLRAADEPYDFYVIMSLTGPAAFLGKDESVTVGAFEKYVNSHGGVKGRPIHTIILDDASTPTNAIQLANQVIAKGVPFFVGPVFGATCGAVFPLVEQKGPVFYCLSSVGHPANGSYAFVYALNNRDFIANGFRYLKAKGVRKVALLETTDATGIDAEAQVRQAFDYPDLKEMKIVDVENYAPTDLTVTAQLTRIKASGADAICNYVTGPAFGTALRGIYESGYTGWIFTSSSNGSRQQMQQYAQFTPDKLVFGTLGYQMTGGVPPRVQAAKQVYRDAMQAIGVTEPTIGNMVPWDPLMIMLDGLRKNGTNVTPAQMRDFILTLHDWPGMMGTYDFRGSDQRGTDPKGTGAMRYDKATDQFIVLSKPGGAPL